MKSPWKFLVGLTGRHDEKGPLEPPAALREAAGSNLSEPETPSLVPVVDAPAAEIDRITSVELEADGFQQVDDMTAMAAIASSVASSKPEKHTEIPRKKRSRRAREQAQVAPRRNMQTSPDTPRRALSNEQVLDDDIRQLRIQLTEKLKLQNDQLRRMLERFDRP
jgi:hypothetical protein